VGEPLQIESKSAAGRITGKRRIELREKRNMNYKTEVKVTREEGEAVISQLTRDDNAWGTAINFQYPNCHVTEHTVYGKPQTWSGIKDGKKVSVRITTGYVFGQAHSSESATITEYE